jgi:hypothetical protein
LRLFPEVPAMAASPAATPAEAVTSDRLQQTINPSADASRMRKGKIGDGIKARK